MGQVALGFRNLFYRLAVFVLMAALLAWFLGGTLFPRAERADGPAVMWRGAAWRLRLSLGGDGPGSVRWELVRQAEDGKPAPWPLPGFDRWIEAAGPIASDELLYVAFRDHDSTEWTLASIKEGGFDTRTLPDRLEVERQFARLRNGLPLQTSVEAAADRDQVIGAGSLPR
jgi:hypothetical protein